MAADTMHPGELDIDADLVRRLVAGQFPDWANRSIDPVASAGTVHSIYRLGGDMAVRLPLLAAWESEADKEFHWLPRLAPLLPLPIPVPLVRGRPGEGYPLKWSVYRWIDGETATVDGVADPIAAAEDMGRFVRALQDVDPSGGPGPGTAGRGGPLAPRDRAVREALAQLDGVIDIDAAASTWEAALAAPEWDGPPRWVHGDLWTDNLLVDPTGRLSGVIDFGCLAVGDPACDAIVAWSLLDAPGRTVFRRAVGADDATWERGRGWAISMALIALPYYAGTNPRIVRNSHRMIDQVLAG